MISPDLIDFAGGICILLMWDTAAYRRGWLARQPRAPRGHPIPVVYDTETYIDGADRAFGADLRRQMSEMIARARQVGPGLAIVRDVPLTCDGISIACRLALSSDTLPAAKDMEHRRDA